MIKTIIIHHLPDTNDLPAAERWFYRYHIPEVLRHLPVSYISFRAVPPPPGAEAFGYYNYKVHENVSAGEGENLLGLLTMTKEVVPLKVIMVNVPAAPTEDFVGKSASFEDRTILRWLTAVRYPSGISVEEAEEALRDYQQRLERVFVETKEAVKGREAAGSVDTAGHAGEVPGTDTEGHGGLERPNAQEVVVRERQRLGGLGPHQSAGVYKAALGDHRPLPVPAAGVGVREHVHPGAAE